MANPLIYGRIFYLCSAERRPNRIWYQLLHFAKCNSSGSICNQWDIHILAFSDNLGSKGRWRTVPRLALVWHRWMRNFARPSIRGIKDEAEVWVSINCVRGYFLYSRTTITTGGYDVETDCVGVDSYSLNIKGLIECKSFKNMSLQLDFPNNTFYPICESVSLLACYINSSHWLDQERTLDRMDW